MSRAKKLNILIPTIFLLFLGAFARHRYLAHEIVQTGTLQDKAMDETSGIAASSVNKDIYYVHNDSGDTSRFFAITPEGKLITTLYYKGDPTERLGVKDCEDIAVGPGPDKNKSYVYVGDIGDNSAVRKYLTVYRVPEQSSWTKGGNINVAATPIHLKYPDGPKDAETLMIDPIQKLIYIVSKRHDTVSVYTSPLNYKAGDTVMLTHRAKLFFKGYKPFKWITAGDVSKDGKQVLLRSYEKVYYWKREANEPMWQTLQRTPAEPEYKQEKQGEAIGFTPDGRGYYTTSEGVYAPIYFYKTP
ncbi:hypothetical protein [Mucilaginibacter sp. dw_454]|uniref:hypothetical protein n=1 Tax=Mucilaginibacter sp. dw_454 TaxID=2720079 RepID=UPI001BD3FB66|nr:hypothetical protein [Mucilaginibacter sp. dw_454]